MLPIAAAFSIERRVKVFLGSTNVSFMVSVPSNMMYSPVDDESGERADATMDTCTTSVSILKMFPFVHSALAHPQFSCYRGTLDTPLDGEVASDALPQKAQGVYTSA
jgi:hypothetical protein